jgi:hypothetical protein
MTMTVLVAFVMGVASPPVQEPEPKKPPIVIETVSAPGVTVRHLTIPWGPSTFADMEAGGESFYAKRTWPFARLETTIALGLDGTKIPPGNYALVFHPNTPDHQGMSLEVRKIAVEEFLQPGNVMTRTPEGETLLRVPIRFDTTPDTEPTLKIQLEPGKERLALVVRYGNRRLVKELTTAGVPPPH